MKLLCVLKTNTGIYVDVFLVKTRKMLVHNDSLEDMN